jgi:hypothetical protein
VKGWLAVETDDADFHNIHKHVIKPFTWSCQVVAVRFAKGVNQSRGYYTNACSHPGDSFQTSQNLPSVVLTESSISIPSSHSYTRVLVRRPLGEGGPLATWVQAAVEKTSPLVAHFQPAMSPQGQAQPLYFKSFGSPTWGSGQFVLHPVAQPTKTSNSRVVVFGAPSDAQLRIPDLNGVYLQVRTS